MVTGRLSVPYQNPGGLSPVGRAAWAPVPTRAVALTWALTPVAALAPGPAAAAASALAMVSVAVAASARLIRFGRNPMAPSPP